MPDDVVMLTDNAVEVLSYWGLKPGDWQVVGFVTGALEGHNRPVIEIGDRRFVLRRQPPDLTEDDTLFRHSFMRHLTGAGLPVPTLLPRPEGATYSVIDNGIYELQDWRDGQGYASDDPDAGGLLEAAAATLGALHQASADFQWQPHVWPEDRSAENIATAYVALIRARGGSAALPESVGNGLLRLADACGARVEAALPLLQQSPQPPEIHIHGDYQAHNLGFAAGTVSAIYDFDAARFTRRLDELAYALLYFCGVRWDDSTSLTPPLVPDGMDVLAAHRFLAAYGREAPPAEGEAVLLAEALALVFPVVFANGVAEDLVYPDDFEGEIDEEEALGRLQWADSFWLWLDRYRDTLAEAWENA